MRLFLPIVMLALPLVASSGCPTAGAGPGGSPLTASETFDGTPVDVSNATNTFLQWERGFRIMQRAAPRGDYRTVYYDFERALRVAVDVRPAGSRHARLTMRLERYIGDTAGGRFSALPDTWQVVRRGDPEEAELAELLQARRSYRPESKPPAASDPLRESTWRAPWERPRLVEPRQLPGGRVAVCRTDERITNWYESGWLAVDNAETPDWCPLDAQQRERSSVNTVILENTNNRPQRTRLTACATFVIPAGWRHVEWYWDETRCRRRPRTESKPAPNMMVIERVR